VNDKKKKEVDAINLNEYESNKKKEALIKFIVKQAK